MINETADLGAAWPVALYAGDTDEAAALASGLQPDARDDAMHVISAWDGDPAAVDALRAACLARPNDTTLLTWCARVTSRLGLPDANRFRDLARILLVKDVTLANLEIVTDPTVLAVAGSTAELYAVHAYRRFTPWDMLSPSLPHIAEG